jgi:hypothetical protein
MRNFSKKAALLIAGYLTSLTTIVIAQDILFQYPVNNI